MAAITTPISSTMDISKLRAARDAVIGAGFTTTPSSWPRSDIFVSATRLSRANDADKSLSIPGANSAAALALIGDKLDTHSEISTRLTTNSTIKISIRRN